MSYKLVKINNDPGRIVELETTEVPEGTNLYYTEDRATASILAHRETVPTYQDKHFYTTGQVAVKTGDLYWNIIHPITIVSVSAKVKTAPSGAALTFYVQKNGAQSPDDLLYDLTIPPNSNSITSNQAAVDLEVGDYIQIDIASVGDPIPGSDLIVSFKYYSHL